MDKRTSNSALALATARCTIKPAMIVASASQQITEDGYMHYTLHQAGEFWTISVCNVNGCAVMHSDCTEGFDPVGLVLARVFDASTRKELIDQLILHLPPDHWLLLALAALEVGPNIQSYWRLQDSESWRARQSFIDRMLMGGSRSWYPSYTREEADDE